MAECLPVRRDLWGAELNVGRKEIKWDPSTFQCKEQPDIVVIPRQMKKEMLRKIHCSHQGPEACIRRTKDVIFWPGMTAEIRQLVSQCSVCNEFLQKQAKEPLMTYAIPTHPWQMVGQDLFTLDSQNYLITVDGGMFASLQGFVGSRAKCRAERDQMGSVDISMQRTTRHCGYPTTDEERNAKENSL